MSSYLCLGSRGSSFRIVSDWTTGSIPGEVENSSCSLCVQTISEAHPASVQCVPATLTLGVKCGRSVTLTTYPI
jgi:hypothetical protein